MFVVITPGDFHVNEAAVAGSRDPVFAEVYESVEEAVGQASSD